MKYMRVLVTGGAGYIGSQVVLDLLQAGHSVVVIDNLCNSSEVSLQRVAELAGSEPVFYPVDIRNRSVVEQILRRHEIEAVVHFAGLKAVGESVAEPLNYYENNVQGALQLVQAMQATQVRQLIFSSSATVYSPQECPPFSETAVTGAVNPYGRSKWMIEWILKDWCYADPQCHVAVLRYFNPAGCHPSGLLGEDPQGIPNNLMPYILGVLSGRYAQVNVFGNDYPTVDGTGVRDYIHLLDLSAGHLAALEFLQQGRGYQVFNLGTGQGYSVLQVLQAFAEVTGHPVKHVLAPRRPGDVAASYADVTLARQVLGWQARYGLLQMCADGWNFAQKNPNGYRDFL